MLLLSALGQDETEDISDNDDVALVANTYAPHSITVQIV